MWTITYQHILLATGLTLIEALTLLSTLPGSGIAYDATR